jgi:transcriptional regulator PpsR
MRPFEQAQAEFAGVDTPALTRVFAHAADLSLVVDADGRIMDLAYAGIEPPLPVEGWSGRLWADLISKELRPKVAEMLRVADSNPTWRQLNYEGLEPPWPAQCLAVRLPGTTRSVVFMRDLAPTAALQQRLVQSQQAMEREYWSFRQAETRYRHLFHVSGEAVLVVDASSHKVLEANPAAQALLGPTAGRSLVGSDFPLGFDGRSSELISTALATVRATGRVERLRAELGNAAGEVELGVSTYRQEGSSHLLLRAWRAVAGAVSDELPSHAMLLKLAQAGPDAQVVTDLEGRVLSANGAFVELVQLGAEDQVRGQSLDRWLGRSGVDLSVLVSNLRQRGAVRLFRTQVQGEYGAASEVEISAAVVPHGETSYLGFNIRDIGRRLPSEDAAQPKDMERAVGRLTELVGRSPLKEIVGETTDLIERMCIEAALELTRDNRASAAEMLGLSRQSLYVKLRRYGMVDHSANDS